MYAAITGPGWSRKFSGHAPIDTYSYKRGGTLELHEFIERNNGCYIVGIVSYNLGYETMDVDMSQEDDLNLPDCYFVAFKNVTSPLLDKNDTVANSPFVPTITRDQYAASFKKIKHHIHEGDIYQANLTHRLETTTQHAPRDLFAGILQSNPTAMSAYLEGSGFEILSFSPEKFISIKNGIIETKPIKGTRPRGQEAQLLASEKETAELTMITDLLRNDMGKVSKTGSVQVVAHREIMKLQTISHTYSHIVGELRPDIHPIDAFLSMFPGGSITGCPKKRAMEIIDEVEHSTRGPYCGSMVVIDPDGNLDSSILIRTIIKKGKRMILPVGGGIVIDSNEADEYQETLDKAAAINQALGN